MRRRWIPAFLRRLVLGDPRIPHRRRNDSTLLAMALALAAHGALALLAPVLVPYLAPVEHSQPQLQWGNNAPFEGSGAGGAVALGTEDSSLPVFVAPMSPPLQPARDRTSPPAIEMAPPAPVPLMDQITGISESIDVPLDPLTRQTPAIPSPAIPLIALSPIIRDEPRPEPPAAIDSSTSNANETAAPVASAATPDTALPAAPKATPGAGSATGAPIPAARDARAEAGRSTGDGGGRTGVPHGTLQDISWVRIRPTDQIAGLREYQRDSARRRDQQVWRGTVTLRFDVDAQGRLQNVRIENSSRNSHLDRAAAQDISNDQPPSALWGTVDNRINIIFEH